MQKIIIASVVTLIGLGSPRLSTQANSLFQRTQLRFDIPGVQTNDCDERCRDERRHQHDERIRHEQWRHDHPDGYDRRDRDYPPPPPPNYEYDRNR